MSIPTQNIKTETLFAFPDEDNGCGQNIHDILEKTERTKSRNYRLHLVRKFDFLCFRFMENTAWTPITLAEVEIE